MGVCHNTVAADVGLLGCDACDAEWLLTCWRIVVLSSLWFDSPRIAWPWGRRHHEPLKHQKPLTLRHSLMCHSVTRHSVTLWQCHVSHPSRLESPAAPPPWGPHISQFAWCECGTICTSCVSVCPQERLRCPCCLSCLLAFLANPCLSCLLAALLNLLTSTCLPAPTKEVSQIWRHFSHTVVCHNSQQMHEMTVLHGEHDRLSVCVSCTKSS
jgi:hypothetical protein